MKRDLDEICMIGVYMSRISYKAFAMVAVCMLPLSACQQNNVLTSYGVNPTQSKYQITADLSGWKMVKQENDPEGYYKIYEPLEKSEAQEEILINYGKNITTSLADSIQQIINVDKQLPCAKFDHKIISRTADSETMVVHLDACQQGPSSLIVYTKVFNAADGQYSIKYSVIATHFDASRISYMQRVVLHSSLEPS